MLCHQVLRIKYQWKWLTVTKFTQVSGTGLSSSVFTSSSTGICTATCMLLTFYFLLSSEWLPLTDSFTPLLLESVQTWPWPKHSGVLSTAAFLYPVYTCRFAGCLPVCALCTRRSQFSPYTMCFLGMNWHCAGPIMLRLLHINASFLPHFAINILLSFMYKDQFP